MISPKYRWNQILQYIHRISDLEKFASGVGTVRLYHGAPAKFAEALVAYGPRVPYSVYALARRVAVIYGLNWSQFQNYAYRKAEVVSKLSTAPATIACKWAWTFPKGEILTDLNSHAMIVVASNALAKSKGISVGDAYEELYNRAIAIGRSTGVGVSMESAPHILGLLDRMELEDKTGSLVELTVDLISADNIGQHDAAYYLKAIGKGITEAEALASWNHQYRDFKIPPSAIISSRIVIRGMGSWEQDVIENMVREGKLPLLPSPYS